MRNNDIVVRLRLWGDSYHLHKESADEIERLRAALNKLLQENRAMEKKIEKAAAIIINARAVLGEKE